MGIREFLAKGTIRGPVRFLSGEHLDSADATANDSPQLYCLVNRENTGNFVVLRPMRGIASWQKRRVGAHLHKNSLLRITGNCFHGTGNSSSGSRQRRRVRLVVALAQLQPRRPVRPAKPNRTGARELVIWQPSPTISARLTISLSQRKTSSLLRRSSNPTVALQGFCRTSTIRFCESYLPELAQLLTWPENRSSARENNLCEIRRSGLDLSRIVSASIPPLQFKANSCTCSGLGIVRPIADKNWSRSAECLSSDGQ